MTCKSCIHFDACSTRGKTQYYGRIVACDDVEERCNLFTNKADVVEVVRCKDCENWDNSIRFLTACACSYWSPSRLQPRYRQPDDFCSKGRRKEG